MPFPQKKCARFVSGGSEVGVFPHRDYLQKVLGGREAGYQVSGSFADGVVGPPQGEGGSRPSLTPPLLRTTKKFRRFSPGKMKI